MADILPQSNRQPDSGRSFIASLLSKLPYVDQALDVGDTNPKYELFDRLSKKRELRVMQQSVITGPFMNQNQSDYYNPNLMSTDKGYHNFIYAQIDTDKIRRLSEYRRMASFSEVADCLDAICDEFINKDENGKVVNIKFSGFNKIDSQEKLEIEKEFHKFVQSYELENKGWGYCRQLLTEGEIFFENIVHEKNKDLGIIGVLNVPGELINPIYDNIQNNVIQNFIFQKPINMTNNQQGQPNLPMPNPNPTNSLQHQLITFEGNQITYINSGIWNDDMSIRIPHIEKGRRAYKQLSLIEDAIVIYRLVRAPERLKFVIDVGNMPPAKAEAYLKQLMQSYWSKKSYDPQNGGSAGNIYDPQSMLDSYWFAKRTGESGSDVQVLQGGQNLGELKDLMYFVTKLYNALGVPSTRLNPEDSYKDGSEILREELRFAKMILRMQFQFCKGLKDAFITHLKIRGWWNEYKLHESYFDLEFCPPSSYFALRQNQNLELKIKNFESMAQQENISKTFAMRHYLGLNDSKISENMEWLRKDAALKWELDQIASTGPNWREHLEAAENVAAQGGAEAGMGGGGGGGGGGSSAIPEFGGGGGGAVGTPEAGAEAGGEVPEGQGLEPQPAGQAEEEETEQPTA
jgi:hypothetical protein